MAKPPAPIGPDTKRRVSTNVDRATKRAAKAEHDVIELSKRRLRQLARLPVSKMAEHTNDPDLTPKDRQRLADTIAARSRSVERTTVPDPKYRSSIARMRPATVVLGTYLALVLIALGLARHNTPPATGVLKADAVVTWQRQNGSEVRQPMRAGTVLRIVGQRGDLYVLGGWEAARGYTLTAVAGPDFIDRRS